MSSREKDSSVLSFAQATPSADGLRTMLSQPIFDVLATEFAGVVGAARYERADARRGARHGYRARSLRTRVGTRELRILRDRAGEFQPSLFLRLQCAEEALVTTRAEMYVQGVRTSYVSAIVEQLCGESISALTVSAMTATLDASLAA